MHAGEPRLPPHPPAVDDQGMPADVGAGPAGQVDAGTLEVVGGAPPPRGDAVRDAGQPGRVGQQGGVHVRLDVARGDGVDGDAARGPAVGERLGQLADGALGGGVGRHVEAALEGEEGAEVYHAAAAAEGGELGEGEHVGAHVAAEGEDGVEVDLHDLRALLLAPDQGMRRGVGERGDLPR